MSPAMESDEQIEVLKEVAEYAFRMEAVAKAYYELHQANGCTGCNICKNYELAYTSIAHAGPSGPVRAES